MKSLVFYFIYAISTSSSRKVYDVEEEALKLYGEDLNSVLLRFRKTPDYLKILQDKVAGMKEELYYLTTLVCDYYSNEMNVKILKTLGVTTMVSPASLRSKLPCLYPIYSPLHLKLRQGDKHEVDPDAPPVSRLDQYPKLHHAVSIANLNYFKAMGFEFAGRAIHTAIKHMGADDTSERSTKQPFADLDPNSKTTTEHVHDHQVHPSYSDITPTDEPDISPDVTASPPDSLRYSYRNKAVA